MDFKKFKKMYRKFIITFAIILFNLLITKGQPTDLSKAINKSMPSIVIVQTYDEHGNEIGLGTGFFIDSLGTGITNYHILQGAKSANIYSQNGKRYPIRYVQGMDKQHDIIRFSIAKDIHDRTKIKYLKIATDLPTIGEEVFTIGNPGGLSFSASTGIISSIRKDEEYGQIIQTTTPISKGCSGSPLINQAGEVVGVMSFFLKEGQNLNFAFSSQYINQLNLEQIYFGFPEDDIYPKSRNFEEKIFRRYKWNVTQHTVRSSEPSLLLSDDANWEGKPKLQYLTELIGRPFVLEYTFEGGKLSDIYYQAIFDIRDDELAKEIQDNDNIYYSSLKRKSSLNKALNIFQILFGELSISLGDDYVCWRGSDFSDTDDNLETLTQKYCFPVSEHSTYLLRSEAEKSFLERDKKRGHKPKAMWMDYYLYKIYWQTQGLYYNLTIGLTRISDSSYKGYPDRSNNVDCSLGIHQLR